MKNLSLAKKLIFASIPALLLTAIIYEQYLDSRINDFYDFLKRYQQGTEGQVYRHDPQLGFSAVPNSRGTQIIGPFQPKISLKFDQNGFRVPDGYMGPADLRRPVVLALGCSFTFGCSVLAEQAYPFIVADTLDGTCLNAAFSSYGLSQMQILARKLIPQHRPDYVLVQFSSWIIDRSQNNFASNKYGKVPSPYFIDAPGGKIGTHPPVFRPIVYDLPVSRYRLTTRSYGDYLSFFKNVGLPLFVHDDFMTLGYEARCLFGWVPRPAADKEKIILQAYQEMEKLCVDNHARMVIVILQNPVFRDLTNPELAAIRKIKSAVIVETEPALLGRLKTRSRTEYFTAYGHYFGNPPIFNDMHPNRQAHQIFADSVLQKLKSGDPEPGIKK